MKIQSSLAGIKVGPTQPVRLMGIINVSPESFYKGSVPSKRRPAGAHAAQMQREGADFIDIGAMSTAPYLKTEISETEEARRLERAVKAIKKDCSLPLSIDTARRGPAEAGLAAGADILNDITGFHRDPALAGLAKHARGVILMAHPMGIASNNRINQKPESTIFKLLKSSLALAQAAGIPLARIVLDPGIGFFRDQGLPWWKWDVAVLQDLKSMHRLGRPFLIGVSRKSFLGHLLGGRPPEERLEASLAATALAVEKGASLVRTHDVEPTLKAVHLAQTLRKIKPF